MELTDEEKENLRMIKKYDQFKWLTEVAVLKSGQSFGDQALINNEPRNASI